MSQDSAANTGSALLSDESLLDWIDESAEALAAVAANADPTTPIPACEGWTMADLLIHVAPWYSGWYPYNLLHPADEGDLMAAATSAPPMPDDHAERIAYLCEACAGFIALARRVDLDAPVWAFWTAQPARFWVKRAATELAIHTWDAQDAIGVPDRIDPDRAATSIDESLRGAWPGLVAIGQHGLFPDGGPIVPNTPAGFIATDTGNQWRVDPTSDGPEISINNLPATVAAGPAHDLLLTLWGRATEERIDITGSRDTIAAWRVPS